MLKASLGGLMAHAGQREMRGGCHGAWLAVEVATFCFADWISVFSRLLERALLLYADHLPRVLVISIEWQVSGWPCPKTGQGCEKD